MAVRLEPVQGDSTVKHVKDLDVVLGADKAVVVLDDTAGVWPSHQRNLLQVLQILLVVSINTRCPCCVRAGWYLRRSSFRALELQN